MVVPSVFAGGDPRCVEFWHGTGLGTIDPEEELLEPQQVVGAVFVSFLREAACDRAGYADFAPAQFDRVVAAVSAALTIRQASNEVEVLVPPHVKALLAAMKPRCDAATLTLLRDFPDEDINFTSVPLLIVNYDGGRRKSVTVSSDASLLHYAARKDVSGDVTQLLLERGCAAANMKDNEHGWTPLHHAAMCGRAAAAEALLLHGADPAILDNHGHTALISATIDAHVELVALLLKFGADAQVTSGLFDGRTPLEIAEYFVTEDSEVPVPKATTDALIAVLQPTSVAELLRAGATSSAVAIRARRRGAQHAAALAKQFETGRALVETAIAEADATALTIKQPQFSLVKNVDGNSIAAATLLSTAWPSAGPDTEADDDEEAPAE
jgi:hypothetical protein